MKVSNTTKKIKCHTNPIETDSTTYEISMAYFRDGTPKEWLVFKKKISRCMIGQYTTTGSTKYALARWLLAGCALAVFSHATSVHGGKTLPNYTKCIQAVMLGVFPQKALQDQKRWMRRFSRNPETCRCKNTSPESLR